MLHKTNNSNLIKVNVVNEQFCNKIAMPNVGFRKVSAELMTTSGAPSKANLNLIASMPSDSMYTNRGHFPERDLP